MRLIVAILAVCFISKPCVAWWEGGHHLISVMAYEQLNEREQGQIQRILTAHPRFSEDFIVPPNVTDEDEIDLWRFGRAGYWPDVARSQPMYTRPNWHFQLGASLTIGQVPNVPRSPGLLPHDATLDTENLHIAQAIELCRKVLRDKTRSSSDRALAVCWITHLVGDAHQPCHAGSLYIVGLFPDGDRGANMIPLKQVSNLHALWDSLLGQMFDAGDTRRRSRAIISDARLWKAAGEAATKREGLNPLTWLEESAECSRQFVYAPEVRSAVEAAARENGKLEMLELSEEYLKNAGELARVRAAFAAQRLKAILHDGLNP